MSAHTAPSTRPLRRDLRAGLWRLGDPMISLASMASIFLGACAAARDGAIAHGTTSRVIPAQALTLAAFLFQSAGAGVGLILDR